MDRVLSALLIIASLLIIVSVTLQEPKTQGMGSISGQETNVFGRSAHKSKDQRLSKLTIFGAVVLFLVAILLTAIH